MITSKTIHLHFNVVSEDKDYSILKGHNYFVLKANDDLFYITLKDNKAEVAFCICRMNLDVLPHVFMAEQFPELNYNFLNFLLEVSSVMKDKPWKFKVHEDMLLVNHVCRNPFELMCLMDELCELKSKLMNLLK